MQCITMNLECIANIADRTFVIFNTTFHDCTFVVLHLFSIHQPYSGRII